MSEQHRYETRRRGTPRQRIITVVAVLFSTCALCVAVLAALIVTHEQAGQIDRINTAVATNQHRVDARWCTLFSTILTAPPEPGQPKPPTPGQIRFAKALVKLAGDFRCVKPK